MTVNGTLDGAYIEGAIISGGYIYGSTIKGPTISGSTISGSSINVTIRENATTTEYTSRKDNTLKKVDTGLEKSGGINFYWYDEEEQGKSGTTYILGQMGAVKGKNSAK
jgi:hypothetical protein